MCIYHDILVVLFLVSTSKCIVDDLLGGSSSHFGSVLVTAPSRLLNPVINAKVRELRKQANHVAEGASGLCISSLCKHVQQFE